MRVDIDNIVRLLSSKIPSGIINLKMESHRHELLQILNELYDSDTANNIIVTVEQLHSDTPVIVEADGDSKSTQSIAASITKTAKSDIKKGKEDSSGDGKDGKKSDGDKKSSVKARTIAPPPKVKPAIVKVVPIKPKTEYKRDKTLGNIDRNFFRRSNLETRVEFEAKLKQSDMFKRIPVKEPFHLKTPSSFPPRYTEILERMFMTEKYDNYNPPISFFCSTVGLGLYPPRQVSYSCWRSYVLNRSQLDWPFTVIY